MNICAKLNICALNAPTSQSPKTLTNSLNKTIIMKKLIERQHILENTKVLRRYHQLGELLKALEKRELTNEIVGFINQHIELLNSVADSEKQFAKIIKDKENVIINHLEKKIKVVPKNYYKKRWLAIGIGAFGLPVGVALGSASGNMGLLGTGLPIGMGIGIAIGSNIDKKAQIEGRQLQFEVKY
jgi:hypothetical protein